jgi:hypothetical protein
LDQALIFTRVDTQERGLTVSEVQPWQQLFEKIIGSWVSRAIYVPAKPRLAGHLAVSAGRYAFMSGGGPTFSSEQDAAAGRPIQPT